MQTCRECGSKIRKCHICRTKINNRIRLFPGWLTMEYKQFASLFLLTEINNTYCYTISREIFDKLALPWSLCYNIIGCLYLSCNMLLLVEGFFPWKPKLNLLYWKQRHKECHKYKRIPKAKSTGRKTTSKSIQQQHYSSSPTLPLDSTRTENKTLLPLN